MPRKTRKKTTRTAAEKTAYHEAGHAVVAFHRGLPVKSVTIIPNEREGSVGMTEHPPMPRGILEDLRAGMWEAKSRRRIEAHVDSCLAGGFSLIVLGVRNPWQGAGNDLEQSGRLAIDLEGSGERATAWLKWGGLVVTDTLECHWKQVEAVARALLERKKLRRAEVRAILDPPLLPVEFK